MPKKPFDEDLENESLSPRRSSMDQDVTRSARSSEEDEDALDYDDEEDIEDDII